VKGSSQNRGLSRVFADFGGVYFTNGLVAFLFAASGPVAIILAVGTRGGLTPSDLSSWIFGAFFINGLISIAFCWTTRQPLVFFWTIPGAVLLGPALGHLSWPEVIGAFIATGILMLALGLSGWVRRAMEAVPMPIVMGMVAGVFLRFGLDLVYAIRDDAWVAAPMVAAFVLVGAFPRLARLAPPLIVALAVGVVMIWALGRFRALDRRPINLDGFAEEDHDLGLVAFLSRHDPAPSVALDADASIAEMDGTTAGRFDMLDAYIATHGIDRTVAAEVDALDDLAFARLMADPAAPRVNPVKELPGLTVSRLVPSPWSRLVMPLVAPSPTPTSATTEATPMITPSIVSAARSRAISSAIPKGLLT